MTKIRNSFVVVLMLVAQSSALFSMEAHQLSGEASKSKLLLKRKRDDDTNIIKAPDAKKIKAARLPIKLSCEASLKQADQLGHTLHCGYYALWNALCSVNAGRKHVDRKSFKKDLELWEAQVHSKRTEHVGTVASFISSTLAFISTSRRDAEVNNLETNELDLLVNSLVVAGLLPELAAEREADSLAAADNVTVFASKNQIGELVAGHGLSSALLARIRKFHQDGLPQAFIINTGADNGQRQSGGFHWIAAVLTRLPVQINNCNYSLKFYDSGSVPKSSQSQEAYDQYCEKLKPMVHSIHELFIEKDLEQLTVRSLLASDLHAVKVYSDQATDIKKSAGDPLFWELDVYSNGYIKFLKSYVRCCIRAVAPERFDELNQKMALQYNKPKYMQDNARYAKYLRRKSIPEMQEVLKIKEINTDWSKFDALDKYVDMLQNCASQLAANKLVATYQKFVTNADADPRITQDLFSSVACEFGIPEIMINGLPAPVQVPVGE